MHVTLAESEILAALWRRGPLSPADLVAEVKAAQQWADPTIKTLLSRLIHKGAVKSERVDGRHQYSAVLTRDDYVDGELKTLADRLFQGQATPMIAALVRTCRPLDPHARELLRAAASDGD